MTMEGVMKITEHHIGEKHEPDRTEGGFSFIRKMVSNGDKGAPINRSVETRLPL